MENKTINIKSAWNKEQIEDRIKNNAPNLEIQLLADIEDNNYDFKLLDNINVNVVHMPLLNGIDCDIESRKGKKYFLKVCEIAQKISKIKNHNIIVVVHISTSIYKLDMLDKIEEVVDLVNEALDKYPNIELAFENTTNYSYKNKGYMWMQTDPFSVYNNEIHFTNIDLAKRINRKRCGVVLDTCHILMLKHNLKYLNEFFDNTLIEKAENIVEELFKQSAPYIKLIHLSSMNGNGYCSGHGVPYTNENKEELKKIINLYNKYQYKCQITLEVMEDDYNDTKNWIKTKEVLSDVFYSYIKF